MYQKKEKHFLQKMSPHLSQLNVAMAHRNYFRRNWQHIQRLKITILGANWQLFRLDRIAKCSYFIFSTQNIKFYWFVMKIKQFCCQFDDTIEVPFLLGINILGSSFWMDIWQVYASVLAIHEKQNNEYIEDSNCTPISHHYSYTLLLYVQLDLGYSATSYPDFSIIQPQSYTVYFPFISTILLKIETMWFDFCFI